MTVTTADHVRDAVCGKLVLPMIPRVVRSTMTLLRQPDAGSQEIAAELSKDPVLSARLLRLANSPFYGGRRRVASIEDAVATVGGHALGTLLVAAGVVAAFVEVPGVNLRDFWMHAAVAAASTRALAQRTGIDREAAYLGGLLHESGHLILCRAMPDAATLHFARQRSRHGQALADAEQAAFGATHPQVSAQWCRGLELPDAVSDAVANCPAPPPGEAGRLAAILRIGASLATAIGDNETHAMALNQIDRDLAAQARLDLDDFAEDFADHYAGLRQAGNDF